MLPTAPTSPLDKKVSPCTVSDCPMPDSEAFHRAVCGHQWKLSHCHHPKVGGGGNNPKAKIRCVACMDCHSKADNYGGMNIVESIQGRRFIAWEGWHSEPDKRKILWDVPMDGEIVRTDEFHGSDPPPEEGGVRTGTGGRHRDRGRDEGEVDSRNLERAGGSGERASSLQERAAEVEGEYEEQDVDFNEELTVDERIQMYRYRAARTRKDPWWYGDWWLDMEQRAPNQLYQLSKELAALIERSPDTISNWANVCRAFPRSKRHWPLKHAYYVAVYPSEDREALLDRAVAEGLTSTELWALAHPEGAQKEPSIKVSVLEEWLHEFMEGYNAEIQAVLIALGRHIRARLEAQE